MPWFVDTKTVESVTTAVVTGHLDANDYFQMRELVRQQQLAQGGHCILMDFRQTVLEISTLDVFGIGSTHTDVFPRGTPYAILFGPVTINSSDARFLENVKLNRGTLAKLFTNEDEAKEWLAACVDASH